MTEQTDLEPLDEFRERTRQWFADNMPRHASSVSRHAATRGGPGGDAERVARARDLQRRLFDGGFAGLVFPKEYGGQGLPAQYQRVFAEESEGYELPLWINMSTLAIMGPTLLDFGTEEQKKRHIPAMLRGDSFWCQLLSEPSGGSDLAGALTTARKDGDSWILNGSKIWTSGGHLRDYGMCLARTNWDVEKHRGLTVFIIDLSLDGIDIIPIRQVNGSSEFCQEYFNDVLLEGPVVVGEVDEGWAVATRMLSYERQAIGGSSPFAGGARAGKRREAGSTDRGPQRALIELAATVGRSGDAEVRQLVAEGHSLARVRSQLVRRVNEGVAKGKLPPASASMLKLMTSSVGTRLADISLEIAGIEAVIYEDGSSLGAFGTQYLSRQTISIGGGTSEMQKNMVSERLLGMPREPKADEGRPFNEVRTNTASTR